MTEHAQARRTDPWTAHEAAASVNVTALERIVLDALRQFADDGATTEQLADWLALSLVTVSPRMRPLQRKRLVIDSGLTRLTKSGRRSIVWRVKRAAMAQEDLPL